MSKEKADCCGCTLEESAFDDKSRYPANVDLIDPLGEIRRCARELWKKNGCPEKGCVMHYWRRAEQQMTAGTPISLKSSSDSPESNSSAASQEAKQNSLKDESHEDDSYIQSLIRKAIPVPMHYHEAICLARILNGCTISVDSTMAIGPLDEEDIAEILSGIEVRSDEAPIGEEQTPTELNLHEWQEKITQLFAEDAPLTNLDRTTVARLITALEKEPAVTSVVHRVQTVSECTSGGESVLKETK